MKSVNLLDSCAVAALLLPSVLACGDSSLSCYGPTNTVQHVRQVKRMQPGVPPAAYGPKNPLEWGQVNFMHTVSVSYSVRLVL